MLALTGVLLPVRIVFVQAVPRWLLLPRELLHVQSVPGRLLLPVRIVHALRVPRRPVPELGHSVRLQSMPRGLLLPDCCHDLLRVPRRLPLPGEFGHVLRVPDRNLLGLLYVFNSCCTAYYWIISVKYAHMTSLNYPFARPLASRQNKLHELLWWPVPKRSRLIGLQDVPGGTCHKEMHP